MANSVADQTVENATWFDVLGADASFTDAVVLEIQNKGNDPILMWIGTTAPADDSTSGQLIMDSQSGQGPEVIIVPAVGASNFIYLRSINSRDVKVSIRAQ